MSCVLLSPNAIACDHTVVSMTIPHTTVVDPNHRKIIIDPNKKFIVALCGIFDPIYYNSEESIAKFEKLRKELLETFESKRAWEFVLIGDIVETVKDLITIKSEIMFITKETRLSIVLQDGYKDFDIRFLRVRQFGDYGGLGTGGSFGSGVLMAGRSMAEAFKVASQLDYHTSEIYTEIPLSILDT